VIPAAAGSLAPSVFAASLLANDFIILDELDRTDLLHHIEV
jgi:hypothetical protein